MVGIVRNGIQFGVSKSQLDEAKYPNLTTTPTLVGKWRGTHKIYQIVVVTNLPTASQEGTIAEKILTWAEIGMPANVPIISLSGTAVSGAHQCIPLPYAGNLVNIYTQGDGVFIDNKSLSFNNWEAYITIKYVFGTWE